MEEQKEGWIFKKPNGKYLYALKPGSSVYAYEWTNDPYLAKVFLKEPDFKIVNCRKLKVPINKFYTIEYEDDDLPFIEKTDWQFEKSYDDFNSEKEALEYAIDFCQQESQKFLGRAKTLQDKLNKL